MAVGEGAFRVLFLNLSVGFVQKLLETSNVTAVIYIAAIEAVDLLLHLYLFFQLHLLGNMPSFDGDRDI